MRRSTTAMLRFVPVFVLLLAGCRGSQTTPEKPRLTTPEATLEAAKAAAGQHDYQALCQLLTPQAQEDMAAGLVMVSRFLVQVAKPNEKGAGQDQAEKLKEKLREVLQKHGLNETAIPKIHIDAKASPEEQAKELRKLAAPIKDRGAFVTEALGVLHKYGDKPDGRLIEADARLKDVKIDGETATATFVQSRNGRESGGPIAFEKAGGEWKISKIPPLMN